jgi:CRISPR-associated protein Cas2
MSRLTIELRPGVFIGNIGRRVREKLWERIVEEWHANALMIYSTNNEQGYSALSNGDTTREIVEYEGMILTQFIHSRKSQMRDLPVDELQEETVREKLGADPV